VLAADPDLFARVAMGRLVVSNFSVSITDPFSFAPKKVLWIDHEWLSGVIFYVVSQLGGDYALFIFKLLFALLTIGAIQKSSQFSNKTPIPVLLFLYLALAIAFVWTSTVRAQVFTYFSLALLFLCIRKYESSKRLIWLLFLPPLICFWANSHGGFVVGLGFFGVWFAFRVLSGFSRRLLLEGLILALAIFVTLINPYGLDYWLYLKEALSMPRPSITEWAPMNLFDSGCLYFHIFTVLTLAIVFRSHQKIPRYVLALLLVSYFYAFKHQRFGPIFVIVFWIYLAPHARDLFEYVKRFISQAFLLKLNRATFLAIVFWFTYTSVVSVNALVLNASKFKLSYTGYPYLALDWLSANRAGGKVLLDFNRGSFGLWRLYPKFTIAIDGRYEEVYPDTTIELASKAFQPETEAGVDAMNKLNPDFIVVDSGAKYLSPWMIAYKDEKFEIWEKAASNSIIFDYSTVQPRPMWKAMF